MSESATKVPTLTDLARELEIVSKGITPGSYRRDIIVEAARILRHLAKKVDQ